MSEADIDTLTASKQLQAAGIPSDQAHAIAHLIRQRASALTREQLGRSLRLHKLIIVVAICIVSGSSRLL